MKQMSSVTKFPPKDAYLQALPYPLPVNKFVKFSLQRYPKIKQTSYFHALYGLWYTQRFHNLKLVKGIFNTIILAYIRSWVFVNKYPPMDAYTLFL